MEYGYTSKDKYIHCWQALMYDPFSQRDDNISWCFRKYFAKSKVEIKIKDINEGKTDAWKVKPIQRNFKDKIC